MKKILSVFLALFLCLSLAVTAGAVTEDSLVYDEADLLTSMQETALNRVLNEISSKHNVQITVITLSEIDGHSADSFVEMLYDGLELGYGANRDGVLLMVSMDPREFRILSNGMPGVAIDSNAIASITEDITPDLSDGEYLAAFETFAQRCDYYIDGHVNGFPFDFTGNLAICLVIGLVLGIIVAFVLKGQLKSVHMQRRAHNYVKPNSMQLTVCRDLYLYRTVNRTRKQTSSSSGSGSRGGSSRSVGGGSF